ncbi:hypothetical protein EZV62_007092 [Acer yangbiense]|uniref:Uncharacterized protein n=1 Tax=Acer yangbiense TaxID=1000413 RepID=A0A5C7I9I0_9ROSI|nr:hypothetical protein EZV62_007092 [Acer yangbiense]
MEEASSSNPQIKDLDGSIKEASDTEEASSSDPQIEDNEDELEKRVEERMKKSNVNIGHSRPLIRAIQENNVKSQKDFLDKNPDAVKSEIDEFGNTVFHLIVQQSVNSATVKLLEELVSKVSVDSPATLEILNVNDMTALDIAASAGNTEAVKVFVKKYKRLLSIQEEEMGPLPIHQAAVWGRKETVRYLLSVTDWTEGIALRLLKHYPHLADRDGHIFWDETVYTLATKYRAFESGSKLGFWERLIYHYIPVKDNQDHIAWPPSDSKDGDLEMQNHKSSTNSSEKFPIRPQIAATFDALGPKLYSVMWDALIQLVPSIKRIHDNKLMHTQSLEIVRLLISGVDWTYKEASKRLKNPVLTAARLGIHEFVNEVLKAYPNSALFRDEERNNIILLAVSYRKEKVFSLTHDKVASIRDLKDYFSDSEGSNILHLAAKFVPSSQVPGSALQMQRELQWFKFKHDGIIWCSLLHSSLSAMEMGNYSNLPTWLHPNHRICFDAVSSLG